MHVGRYCYFINDFPLGSFEMITCIHSSKFINSSIPFYPSNHFPESFMSESSPKRQRHDGPKYPYVDFDHWMKASVCGRQIELTLKDPLGSVPVPNFIRPQTTWFTFNEEAKITSECMSAQYSNVAHCPFVQGEIAGTDECMWIDKTLLAKYIEIRESKSDWIAPTGYTDALYEDAILADVVANAARRDPSKYALVSGGGALFGINKGDSKVGLVVVNTPVEDMSVENPWEWEQRNRCLVLERLMDGYEGLADFGDMVVPIRGLICSVFFAGLIFRLGQLFQKVSVVKSPLCMHWDDRAFIVCIGKRKVNKYVEKSLRLTRRLVVSSEDCKWGYAVPPICLKDPTVCTWIRDMNRGLMTSVVYEKSLGDFATLEKWASSMRIKKYLFWQEAQEERLVGFYFGSFNPVHENHIALAKYAHDQLGMERVFLIPNQTGNKEKEEDMVSLQHRSGMIKARIEDGGSDLAFLETFEPLGNTQRWEAKANIAEGTTNKLFEYSRFSGQPVLILGQDSWNKAVIGSSRDKTTRHFIGIAKIVKSKIFVFPRTNTVENEIVNAPKPIRNLVKVVEGYTDPIDGLSSSMIRTKVKNEELDDVIPGLHASVREYLDRHKLYR